MKFPLASLLLLSCIASLASADQKKIAGPNGGRVLTVIEPHAEFFVTAERQVQITFVDDNLQAIPPTEQTVIVTAGNRSAPVTLNFVRRGNVLVSDGALPTGNDFPTVVQIKATPGAKTTVARFNLNMIVCSECQNAEYACTCDH